MRHEKVPTAALSTVDAVFEDDEILVLDKPAGLLVLPDRYNPGIPHVLGLLKSKFAKIYVVHRIDKDTSGVIVFAKTEESHRLLSHQFQTRSTEKVYLAICAGESGKKEGRIDVAISENPNKKAGMRIDRVNGKSAVTLYKVLEEFEGYSFVEARPKTGRTHQIRIHLSAISIPILGDSLYGGGSSFSLSQIKPSYRGKGSERPLLRRAALHASRISIVHPTTRRPVTFETDLPKDMKIVLNYLRKYKSGKKLEIESGL